VKVNLNQSLGKLDPDMEALHRDCCSESNSTHIGARPNEVTAQASTGSPSQLFCPWELHRYRIPFDREKSGAEAEGKISFNILVLLSFKITSCYRRTGIIAV